MVLERAKSLALANNFVTDLTSLVVVIPSEARNSNTSPATFRSGGSGSECTGMCVPVNTYNMSSLISPEKNPAASGPCNITLYSEELLLGESVTFSSSVPDLALWDFQEKLESVKVEGACNWKIFTGKKSLSLSLSLSLSVSLSLSLLSSLWCLMADIFR